MKKKHDFTCYILGETNLSTQCAEIILQKKHGLFGIISSNDALKNWAKENNIPFFENISQVKLKPVDYIFSIANYAILPKAILTFPRYFAVNYHDAPLPKYAGVHATSWAILNNEKQHGVTWHIMDEQIDAGDILKQSLFNIEENDTALSLNLKCYEIALQTFAELVDELANQTYRCIAQDLTQRTYYGSNYKPYNNGWISWNKPAEEIDRLCRALTFGSYINRLSSPKLVIGNHGFIVGKISVLDKISHKTPGTVVKITQNYWQIATATKDVALERIIDLTGKVSSLSEICQQHKIDVAKQLPLFKEVDLRNFELESENLSQYESFWVKQLENIKSANFPFLQPLHTIDRPKSTRHCLYKLILSSSIQQKLSPCLPKKIDTSIIWLSVWLIYLYRLDNQETLGVGFNHPELCNNKIFLTQQLPFSVHLQDEFNFLDCLKIIEKQYDLLIQKKAYLKDVQQRYPNLSDRLEIFPVLVEMVQTLDDDQVSKRAPIVISIAKFEATTSLWIHSDLVDTNLQASLDNIPGHLNTFLEGIIENPNQPIAHLPLLTSAERQQVLLEWNKTEAHFPHEKMLHQLFEEQAEKTPDNIAIVFENQQLTYRELNEKANQLGHYLKKLGVKPDTLVAICIDRSLEMMIAILGILKAGGAYVPIDPEYPAARIEYIIKNCQCNTILTRQTLLPPFLNSVETFSKERIICFDTDWRQIQNENKENLPPLTSENLAYVIYTSGSTGNPKGVLIEHKSIVNFLCGFKKILNINSKSNFLATTSLSFDIALLELYLPLITGARCIIAKQIDVANSEKIQEIIKKHSIELLQFTPAVWKIISESTWADDCKIKILSGGEALTASLAKKLLRIQHPVWNLYGPTETTIWSTAYKFNKLKKNKEFVSIGTPIANTQCYILDKNLQPLPFGASGELYIGGIGLARGYLNQPELNQTKFIPNPFSKDQNSRLYKTGDLARWLPEGKLDYIGRVDNQVKIRGFRIELGEIENALLLHPTISQAIVITGENRCHKQLIAYIIRKKITSSTSPNLRKFLAKILPEYMLPHAYIEIETVPLTPNGKVDRAALMRLTNQKPIVQDNFIPASTNFQIMLLDTWQEVLGVEPISITDDFFMLGGDSISAMQIIAKVKEKGLSLNIKEIFLHPTIKELADVVEQRSDPKSIQRTEPQPVPLMPIEHYDQLFKSGEKIENIYPLTPMQKGLLFHALYRPNSEAYFVQLNWQCYFNDDKDIQVFCQSLQVLIDNYDVLRTYFHWNELTEPAQIVQRATELVFKRYDWQDLSKNNLAERLQTFLKVDQQTGFDLSKAPPMRLTIIQLAEHSYQIIWSFHHILVDGWSLSILFHELNLIYSALCQKKVPPLIKAFPYVNYVTWLQQQDLGTAETYWKHYLAGFSTPTDLGIANSHYNTTDRTVDYCSEYATLSPELIKQLDQFSKQHRLTLSTLFQGLWAILLARYSQTNDVIFGVTMSARPPELSGVKDMVGLSINTLPLRTRFSEKHTVLDCLHEIQARIVEISSYHYTPLNKIEEWSGLSSETNLFKSIVVFENYPIKKTQGQLFDFQTVQIIDPTHYLLTFIIVTGDKLDLKLNYDSNAITKESIQKLMGHLKTLLSEMMEHPSQSIAKLNFLTTEERQQILIDWNQTDINLPLNVTVHQLFEKQVEKTPHNIAVVCEEQQFTYHELNDRANQLAHYLRKQGIKPDVLAAICMDRSLEMIISILGVLKAGGGYVSIDPDSPDAHIKSLLVDCHPTVLLTRKFLFNRIKKLVPAAVKIISLDQDGSAIGKEPTANPHPITQHDNLLYVVYTSGSTGKPKAIVHTHQTIINLIHWQSKTVPYEHNKITQFANMAFDVSVQEIFYALLNGYELHIVPTLVKKSMQSFLHFIQSRKINEIFMPTALLNLFASEVVLKMPKLDYLSNIIVAGEALKITSSIRQFFTHYKNARLVNHYGPSETHVVSCFYLSLDTDTWTQFSPIGKPIANIKVFILDQQLQLLPVGIIGELYVSGRSLARGYLNQPELTREKFIPNPFSKNPKDRLYKTGDLARWLADGNLDYVGRIDNQVKIRGFRIELGEIEAQIQKHPEIRQSAVVVQKTPSGDKFLAAYLVTDGNKNQNPIKIRNFLKKILPDYMIPTAFVFLKKLPLTPNGKIDKKAFPNPKRDQLIVKNTYVAPRNIEEKKLVSIWQEVLSIQDIGVYDNFFELGGHSLSVLQVLLGIRKHFTMDLPIRTLFDAPTIAQIAEIIRQDRSEKATLLASMTMDHHNPFTFCLVPLKSSGSETPLFLIHPIGGTVFWYLPLVKYLHPEQPLYAIQDPCIEKTSLSFKTIEEIASFYIDVIRSVQPNGPYLIGGASAGGTISFEIARQLLGQKEKVDFIGLFDSWVPHPDKLRNQEFFEAMMLRQYNQMQQKLVVKGVNQFDKLLKLQWQRVQVLDKYVVSLIDSKLTLFKATEPYFVYQSYQSPMNFWENHSTKPVDVHLITGDHETIFQEPNVQILAEEINTCLYKLSNKSTINKSTLIV